MTDKHSTDDLLSSFFDGEATPEERAEVERRLRVSAEARRELTEIGQVSSLIRSLPRAPLPEQFAAQVLARAEREMLLAAPAGSGATAHSVARRRTRWFALGSLIATAAVVLVVTTLMGPRRESDPLAARGDHRTAGGAGPEAVAFDDSDAQARSRPDPAPRAGGLAGSASDSELGRPNREQPSDEFGRSSDFPAAAPVAPAEPLPAGAAPSSKAEAAPAPSGRRAVPLGELANVRAGEIVRLAEQTGNGVAVVELTVVDVRETAGAMQVLLIRSGEQPESAAESDLSRDKADAAVARSAGKSEDAAADAPGGPRQGELLAMYVETPGDRLASVLDELQRRGLLGDQQFLKSIDPERIEVAGVERSLADRPPAALADRRDAREPSPTLAAVVRQTKARLGTVGETEGLRDESAPGRPADRARDGVADAPVRLQTQLEPAAERARDLAARQPDVVQSDVVQSQANTATFQLLFRPTEKSLDVQTGSRAPARKRFNEESGQSISRTTRPAATRLAQSGSTSGGGARADVPLRVIFVFRQNP
ncbi:MAG TPA: hypothetical protein VML55_14560 [Planctomycetaceae bacterium]|nr:hypothetical protein [Planctomycetaceae bacterium]